LKSFAERFQSMRLPVKTLVDDSSSGGDKSTWGPELLITEARLDQLVHDSVWTPTLATGACSCALAGIAGFGRVPL
jgi:hypothetical protein